jgi:hypothetical protein
MKGIFSARPRLLIGLAAAVVLALATPTLAQAGAPELHSVGSATETRFTDNTFTTKVSTLHFKPGTPTPEELTSTSTVLVTEYADNSFAPSAVIGQATYDADGTIIKKWGVVKGGPAREFSAKDSGSGGTSSASGCHRVTVTNVYNTLLGATAFKLVSWTDSCWNRAKALVTVSLNDAAMRNVDPQYSYDAGWIIFDGLFYDYSTNNGQPRSAYRFRAQKKVTNCLLKVGCVGTFYPMNIVRSYFNGTWAWETS